MTKFRPTTNFAYVIFITPIGKGYGCFAIDQVDKNDFKVGASFCHPNDRNLFQKEIGRTKSKERAADSKIYSFDKDMKPDNKAVILKWLFDQIEENKLPSWVKKSLLIDAYVFKLTNDNLSLIKLVEELDLAEDFVSHYINAKGFVPIPDNCNQLS